MNDDYIKYYVLVFKETKKFIGIDRTNNGLPIPVDFQDAHLWKSNEKDNAIRYKTMFEKNNNISMYELNVSNNNIYLKEIV